MRMIRGVEHDTGRKVERIWSAGSRGDRIMWRRVPRPAGKRDLEVKSTFLRAVVGLSCSKVNSKLHQGITNN